MLVSEFDLSVSEHKLIMQSNFKFNDLSNPSSSPVPVGGEAMLCISPQNWAYKRVSSNLDLKTRM